MDYVDYEEIHRATVEKGVRLLQIAKAYESKNLTFTKQFHTYSSDEELQNFLDTVEMLSEEMQNVIDTLAMLRQLESNDSPDPSGIYGEKGCY